MEMDALNYDPEATQDDGSCAYLDPSFSGLVAEAVPGAWEGWFVHRVYATFDNPEDELVAVFGDAEAPLFAMAATGFGQDSLGVFGFNALFAPDLVGLATSQPGMTNALDVFEAGFDDQFASRTLVRFAWILTQAVGCCWDNSHPQVWFRFSSTFNI